MYTMCDHTLVSDIAGTFMLVASDADQGSHVDRLVLDTDGNPIS